MCHCNLSYADGKSMNKAKNSKNKQKICSALNQRIFILSPVTCL